MSGDEKMSLRIPPQNLEAERAVLGSVLLESLSSMSKINRFQITSDSFFDRRHALLFKAFEEMTSAGRMIDTITVAEYLKTNGLLEQAGGYDYLLDLMSSDLLVHHVDHYADIIRQHWIKREILTALQAVETDLYLSENGDELLKLIPERFMGIVEDSVDEQTLSAAVDEMMVGFEAAASGEALMYGLPLPWDGLNDAMCGIPEGFGFIAARPSMGKTTLEDVIFCHWARLGIPVGRISMDMTRVRLLQRAASRAAGVSLPKIKKGHVKIGSKQWDSVVEESRLIKGWPMWINDKDRNLSAICTWIRMMVLKQGVRAVSIDYIQQVMTGSRLDGDENTRITVVSGTLKALANELGISIIALSQLSRGSDKDKRIPTMADLRGSGSLEQDAQWIWMLYKDKDAEESKVLRPMWIDIVKQQDGEQGGLPYWMYPNYFNFAPAMIGFDGDGNEIPFADLSVHQKIQSTSVVPEELEVEV